MVLSGRCSPSRHARRAGRVAGRAHCRDRRSPPRHFCVAPGGSRRAGLLSSAGAASRRLRRSEPSDGSSGGSWTARQLACGLRIAAVPHHSGRLKQHRPARRCEFSAGALDGGCGRRSRGLGARRRPWLRPQPARPDRLSRPFRSAPDARAHPDPGRHDGHPQRAWPGDGVGHQLAAGCQGGEPCRLPTASRRWRWRARRSRT